MVTNKRVLLAILGTVLLAALFGWKGWSQEVLEQALGYLALLALGATGGTVLKGANLNPTKVAKKGRERKKVGGCISASEEGKLEAPLNKEGSNGDDA